MKVQSKVIVVTGAGSGIGRELALHLLSKGARVAGIDVNPTALKETSVHVGQWKGQFEGFVVNVAEKSAVEALPEDVLARFGTVDGVIISRRTFPPSTRRTYSTPGWPLDSVLHQGDRKDDCESKESTVTAVDSVIAGRTHFASIGAQTG